MREKSRESVAYHEAGHFAVAYFHAPSSYRGTLTIKPDAEAGTLGHSSHEAWSSEEMAREEVVVCFAGFAAEKHFDPNADASGAAQDDEEAREILSLLGQEGNEDEWRAKADRLVADHWPEIEALAKELLRLETITDSCESDTILDVARGDATVEDLEQYRAFRDLVAVQEAELEG